MFSSYFMSGRCYCHFTVADVYTTTVYLQLLCWLMLLPSGRWNGHILSVVCCWGRCYCHVAGWNSHTFILCVVMADVIAQWQVEWPLQGVSVSLLVDVIPQGADGYLGRITLGSEVLCRTSSHI